uniref:Uncharacterized protein n=1 Tax=Anguilla anguilla TaxID=7936 RepID=A0A0E9S7U8_ANGAN
MHPNLPIDSTLLTVSTLSLLYLPFPTHLP